MTDRTPIVVTSDHGEHLGEHGMDGHGSSLYRPVLQIPLLVWFPVKVPAAERVREPVTLRDVVAATIVDLVGLEDARIPGRSLARLWSGAQAPDDPGNSYILSEMSATINAPEWLPASKGDMKSLVAYGRHYIKNGDNEDELYDFDHDPAKQRNV